jgi:hypothetical protein
MATVNHGLLSRLSKSSPASERQVSIKARDAVHSAFVKSGGKPTAELKRVYGAFLKYKRDKAAARKD